MTATARLICGDNLDAMRQMADNSVDAIVSDPPGGIAFMGKGWDGDRGGRAQWVAWMTEVMSEARRVLKPGGHALVWALPRTSHWTALALEDAGFEIRDAIQHLFGSGFPKSLAVDKAIDKAVGAQREVVGVKHVTKDLTRNGRVGDMHVLGTAIPTTLDITAPATPDAERWQGWGTALKPAAEIWWLCRKPLSEPTVAANVLRWGTGALNIDASRIGVSATDPNWRPSAPNTYELNNTVYGKFAHGNRAELNLSPSGRWPANVILSHADGCRPTGTRRVKGGTAVRHRGVSNDVAYGGNIGRLPEGTPDLGYTDTDGYEVVEAWDCQPDCPVAMLDAQSGERPSGAWNGNRNTPKTQSVYGTYESRNEQPKAADTGGASRYFKVIPPDDAPRFDIATNIHSVCMICASPYAPTHDTMNATKEVVSCDNARIVEPSLHQSPAPLDSVHVAVQDSLLLDSEDSSLNRSGPVNIAANGSGSTKPTHMPTVVASALDLLTEQLDQRVRSAANLCDSCVTATAQSLAAMLLGQTLASLRGTDSMPEHRRRILNHSLALYVESLADIATIPTTASLSLLFGYVRDAIASSIPTDETENESGQTRFLYKSKASRTERNRGLDSLPERPSYMVENGSKTSGLNDKRYDRTTTHRNNHPTVKPVRLCRYLVKLICPPGGVVLDPFMGSGSTGVAALREGFSFIGIDQEAAYVAIAKARIEGDSPLFNVVTVDDPDGLRLDAEGRVLQWAY